MKHNVRLTLSYAGTHYLGYQKTKMGPSIEEVLEKTLIQVLQEKIVLQAASRTDRGVHAEGQIVNFFTQKEPSLSRLLQSLRRLLPSDIAPLELSYEKLHFHPTLDVKGKEYHYWICNTPVQLPFHREFSWHVHTPLSIAVMQEAATILEGRHDFSAFANARYLDARRTVEGIKIIFINGRVCLQIKGDHFLYKMVRNIVGTLVNIGELKIPISALKEILNGKERAKAGVTAPAHGLCLKRVFY